MRTRATTDAPADTDADTIAIGVIEGEPIAHDVEDGALQALVDAGEAKPKLRKVAVAHAAGKRWLLVGLGQRDGLDAEAARVAAATAQARASELGTRVLAWEVPHHVGADVAGALVEGTVLGAYRFERFKSERDEREQRIEELVVSSHEDVGAPVATATVVAEAANAARDLENMPANELTPTALGEHALALAAGIDGLECEVEHRAEIEGRGMGAFAAVARGSDQEPALITLRYEGAAASGPVLGLVGKAVTFDSGGLSIKPSGGMHEMKFDMGGGAAVIEAVGAIARLGLPVRIVAVVGATENLPSGHAMKPGDIVRARTGTTIEVNNTDAEGRLVLADCIAHAKEQGAERLVDAATLTGACVVALGKVYAGLMSNDDGWAAAVEAAGRRTGELVWRLPLHRRYAEMVNGRYADIANVTDKREAGAITAAEFLHRFAGDTPWAHLDIAGQGWDLGVPYAPKGGSGFGVRLLVELARGVADGEPAA